MKASDSDLKDFSLICEQSLLWKSKPTLAPAWLARWRRNSWIQHLSGRTLKPSHSESFVDAWTSFLADFPAPHFPRLASVNLPKTPGIFSHTSLKGSESADQQLCFSKMLKESSLPKPEPGKMFSSMSSEAWSQWVTDQRQEFSQRLNASMAVAEERHTNASESSSWGTPNTMDYLPSRSFEAMKRQATNGGRKNRKRPGNLREQVDPLMCQAYKEAQWEANNQQESKNWATKDWQTPIATEARQGYQRRDTTKKAFKDMPSLTTLAVDLFGHPVQENPSSPGKNPESWATPQARDFKSGKRVNSSSPYPQLNTQIENTPELWGTPRVSMAKGLSKNQVEAGAPKKKIEDMVAVKTNGKLNPNWVEQLMGLPVGWTQLPAAWMQSPTE